MKYIVVVNYWLASVSDAKISVYVFTAPSGDDAIKQASAAMGLPGRCI